MCACVCVCERERVCVCNREGEREGERETEWVGGCLRERRTTEGSDSDDGAEGHQDHCGCPVCVREREGV